jgi:hypothetical protein
MMKTLSLILPVVIPSWRFFKTVEPSPRVQWALFSADNMVINDWQEFRPRPQNITPFQMLKRLFWNPEWNETLFVLSCAERIAETPSAHSIHEIRKRILSHIKKLPTQNVAQTMQFRLIFIYEDEAGQSQDILFQSQKTSLGQPTHL